MKIIYDLNPLAMNYAALDFLEQFGIMTPTETQIKFVMNYFEQLLHHRHDSTITPFGAVGFSEHVAKQTQ